MTTAPFHAIKSAAAVLAEDVICQSFVQSSSTLAYACLLIRRRRYELAAHVLQSLEAKPASRFKDMVFYLQAQIGIETGEYALVKRRLEPRVHQHPNDMIALSLLECCIYNEFEAWEQAGFQSEATVLSGAPDMRAAPTPVPAPPPAPEPVVVLPQALNLSDLPSASDLLGQSPEPASHRVQSPRRDREYVISDAAPAFPVSSQPPAFNLPAHPAVSASGSHPYDSGPIPIGNDTPVSGLLEIRVVPEPAVSIPAPAESPAASSAPAASAIASAASPTAPVPQNGAEPGLAGPRMDQTSFSNGDFGVYQPLVADGNTQSLALWNAEQGKYRAACRNAGLEPLVALLPQELPHSLQEACSALEGGILHKICFSFQNLTVTSFHAGAENMGLITGNINQSLLSMVRAENIFGKAGAIAGASARAAQPAGHPAHE